MSPALSLEETIRATLRKLILRSENKPERMKTLTSTRFRRKASVLAKQAENEPNAEKMFKLVQEALSWITLAENEESLADSDDHGPC